MKLKSLVALAALALTAAAQDAVYKNDFQSAEVGKVPAEIMVHDGDFKVAEDAGNKFLELPGAPLETFTVLFGPSAKEDRTVSARVFGTAKGRRGPSFNVGLNGVGGYKLQVSASKELIELVKGDAGTKSSVPYKWTSGKWTRLSLTLKKVKDGEWKVDGRVWLDGEAEPADPTITFADAEAPTPGKASTGGSPFSNTPIRFDDLFSGPAK